MREKDQNMPSEQEVRQWLLSTSKGDQSSFTMLLRMYWNKVYTQAITYLKSAEQAQEITQDIFVKLWSVKEKLVEVENFSGYLFILSRNEIITALRRKKNSTVLPSDDLEELLLQPDRQFQYKESYNKILHLIEQLPPVRRKALDNEPEIKFVCMGKDSFCFDQGFVMLVPPFIARAFESADVAVRRKAEIYINAWLNDFFSSKSANEQLIDIMKKGTEEAKRNGFTPDKLNELLKDEE